MLVMTLIPLKHDGRWDLDGKLEKNWIPNLAMNGHNNQKMTLLKLKYKISSKSWSSTKYTSNTYKVLTQIENYIIQMDQHI